MKLGVMKLSRRGQGGLERVGSKALTGLSGLTAITVIAGATLAGCGGVDSEEEDALVIAAVGGELPASDVVVIRDGAASELVILLAPPQQENEASALEVAVASLTEEGWVLDRSRERGKWWSWEGRRGRALMVLGEAEAFARSGEDRGAREEFEEAIEGGSRLVVARIEEGEEFTPPGTEEHEH